MWNRPLVSIAMLAGMVALAIGAGCSGDPSGAAYGTLTLTLTDAPYPYAMIDSAGIAIDSVEVHVSAHSDGDSGFWTVDDPPDSLNLLELRNGVTELIGTAVLPAGDVNQMRLVLSSAWVVLDDSASTRFVLDVPSGESSGLKVKFDPPIEITGGEDTNVLIDVDVSQSFSAIPNGATRPEDVNGFRFHPVLRVSVSDEAGRVAGTVATAADSSGIEHAQVALWDGGDQYTSTQTDAGGDWMILGVPPGNWTVRVEAAGYSSQSKVVTVSVDTTTGDVDFYLDAVP